MLPHGFVDVYWLGSVHYVILPLLRGVATAGGRYAHAIFWTSGILYFHAHLTSFHFHSFVLAFFLCFIVLFKSCCPHAQVFERTVVHEFHIFYSQTKSYFFCSAKSAVSSRSLVLLN